MLSERYPTPPVLSRAAWRPRPDVDDRAAWLAIPDLPRRAALVAATTALTEPWRALPVTGYLAYPRTGDRAVFEDQYFGRRTRLTALVVAECLEDKGRFLDRILEGAWLVAEESTWCLPAHVGRQAAGPGIPDITDPVIDLFAAETAGQLAWLAYLLAPRLDAVSRLLRERIRQEVDTRVLTPFLTRDDYFWMGFDRTQNRPNNWNPWIVSNLLTAAGLLEEDETRRGRLVTRSMRCLDNFLAPYPKDGGCDEGPSYWTRAAASVYDCLETLESLTDGHVSVWSDPLIGGMARYVRDVRIAGSWYVNFADSPPQVALPARIVYGFGRKVGDPGLCAMAADLDPWDWRTATNQHVSPERLLRDLFTFAEVEARPASAELYPRDAWYPEIQVMVSRDRGGSTRGLFVAAKGGHNAESHNHNDVGSFVVFSDGAPLIVDAGVGVYTRATFDKDLRYTIWTMQSAYHTLLPVIDGAQQLDGRSYEARSVTREMDDAGARLTMEIAAAWGPDAGPRSWVRSIEHRRGDRVTITDVWAHRAAPRVVTAGFLTPCRVRLTGPGSVRLTPRTLPGGRRSGDGRVTWVASDGRSPVISVERIVLDDKRLCAAWGAELTRVVIRVDSPGIEGRWLTTVQGQA